MASYPVLAETVAFAAALILGVAYLSDRQADTALAGRIETDRKKYARPLVYTAHDRIEDSEFVTPYIDIGAYEDDVAGVHQVSDKLVAEPLFEDRYDDPMLAAAFGSAGEHRRRHVSVHDREAARNRVRHMQPDTFAARIVGAAASAPVGVYSE